MPLPKPRKDEDKDDFMSRCMADETMRREYEESDQRYAVCNTQWESTKRKGNTNEHE